MHRRATENSGFHSGLDNVEVDAVGTDGGVGQLNMSHAISLRWLLREFVMTTV